MNKIALIGMVVLAVAAVFAADEKTEASKAIEQLCSQPVRGWITQGRIEALHEATDVSANEIVITHETVTTDGNRFSWRINVTEHIRGGNPVINPNNDVSRNRDRLFVWDGKTYTMHFKTGKQAVMYENPSAFPVKVNGPLTAGLIPWGYGAFTEKKLTASLVSTDTVSTDKGSMLRLTFQQPSTPTMRFELDPANNYAVRSYTLIHSEAAKTVNTYGQFTQVDGRAVPQRILTDHYRDGKLVSTDAWSVLSVKSHTPSDDAFSVTLQDKDTVEYHSPALAKTSFFRHSAGKKIASLLDKHVVHSLKKNIQKQNCASVAAAYVLDVYGAEATDTELSALVSADSGMTSLYKTRQLMKDKQLHCMPVKTSLATLNKRTGCRAILHLPEQKHFVVLDRITKKDVWLVDLDRQFFYRSLPIGEFKQQWTGIALLVSDQPLDLQAGELPVPESVQKTIVGSADYTCTYLIQDYDFLVCPEMMFNTCVGRYYMWYQRWGCELNENGEACRGTGMVGHVFSPCVHDPHNPGTCDITGNFTVRPIRACVP